MGVETLQAVFAAYQVLLLDTMVFSYHLSDHPRYASLTSAILAAVESGQVMGLTTTITLAELLTLPAQRNNRQALQDYELFLTSFPNLRWVPLDVDLARETAVVRGATGLRTPDAVQVAAARLYRADVIITNDHHWASRVTAPAMVLLDSLLGGPPKPP